MEMSNHEDLSERIRTAAISLIVICVKAGVPKSAHEGSYHSENVKILKR